MWSSVLSLIATIGFGPILGLVDRPNLRWLFYTITVINLLLVLSVAILNNMHLIYNITTKIVEHLEKSAKFGALFRRIKDQFYMPVDIRYNAKTLLDFVSERYNELTAEKLFIRKLTEKNWDNQIIKNDNGDINYDVVLLLPEAILDPAAPIPILLLVPEEILDPLELAAISFPLPAPIKASDESIVLLDPEIILP